MAVAATVVTLVAIDVAVVVKTDLVTAKYFRHYERRQPVDIQ